jgi:hypothetical protein
MKGALPWLVHWARHAGTRDVCPALAALVGQVQNFLFLTVHYIFHLIRPYTVLKMGLKLRSIERMLKMQFSMARKFMLQPLRKKRTSVIFRLTCHALRKLNSIGGARSSYLRITSLRLYQCAILPLVSETK